MNEEAYTRYATAKEYVEAIKLVITSPHYAGQHVIMAIRPTHLLAGFATELYFKAWLLADGMSSSVVQNHGHRIRDLHISAEARGFIKAADITSLVEFIAEPHGQNGDYVFRYTRDSATIEFMDWKIALPILDRLDVIVDNRVGASAKPGLTPKHF